MASQTHAAIDEADLVVFIVDGREGLISTDVEIADYLRRGQKRVLLCVNKIDGIGEDRASLEFHELGFEHLVQTAASHNRGIHSMIRRRTISASVLSVDRMWASQPWSIVCLELSVLSRMTSPAQHAIPSLKAIEEANVCVMLIDASEGLTEQDMHLLSHVIDKGRALVVAVNKWDALNSEQRDNVKTVLERRVEFLKFTRIHFISALKGSGVADVFKSIDKAHRSAFVNMSTPQLTRLLELAVTQHQPPMIAGRRIKLRYAHQGGVNPPIIVVHGRQADKVSQVYKRYLSNWFLKQLKLFGTPLRIEFRQGDNPFSPRSGKVSSKRPR